MIEKPILKDNDPVKSPAHYQGRTGMDAGDLIWEFGLGYWDGLALKYLLRHQKKGNPRQDLQKAVECLSRRLADLDKEEKHAEWQRMQSGALGQMELESMRKVRG